VEIVGGVAHTNFCDSPTDSMKTIHLPQ